ncbi:FG-GAP repeat domain-containing protein [Spirosoma soli]|uniref:FG-GAP repeat domain-containing protein n=1 Tax=Spirosoma soli TaxID=1770529 RepID=A0ABW5MCU5_9BACT
MRFSWLTAFIFTSLLAFEACQSASTTETNTAPPVPTQLSGRQLAQTYCGSCHLAPDPSLLDKVTWRNGVLPQMALRMGQSDQQMNALASIGNMEEMTRILQAKIFPESPMLDSTDWQKIVTYYITTAPEKPLPQPARKPVQLSLSLFQPKLSKYAIDGFVTLLKYDSIRHQIWAGDGRGHLYALNKDLRRTDSVQLSSPVTDLRTNRDGSTELLTVGMLNPNDRLTGAWSHLNPTDKQPTPVLQGLQRPVAAIPADLNQDGREDVVICQFGNYLGKLSWHEKTASGYTEHLLDSVPGVRTAIIQDVNKDKWPDVVALLSQGDEQIAVYYNQQNGSFVKKTVLRFPSVYGSSYLELNDIDLDGDLDLVYTNGDNADYSIVLKPYHGVRIFLNDGQFRFRQAWFYPMHGATQTVIRDFDQDGDADIAAIAHYPDFSQEPNQGFVYFENQGNLSFAPRTFTRANQGRWLRIDAGDVDQDGDDDILLGSFFRPTNAKYADLMNQWAKPGAGILLLENKLK